MRSPDSRSSIGAASAASRGLPSTAPSSTTAVSAAEHGPPFGLADGGPDGLGLGRGEPHDVGLGRLAGQLLFFDIRRPNVNGTPIWRSSSLRLGEAEAR